MCVFILDLNVMLIVLFKYRDLTSGSIVHEADEEELS